MPKRLTSLDLRRRNCTRCGRWKHAIDFPWRWKQRGKELPIPYIQAVCKSCKSAHEKQRYHALSPEAKEKRVARAVANNRERRWKLDREIAALEEQLSHRDDRIAALKKRIGLQRSHINGETLLELTPFRMFLIRQRMMYGTVAKMALRMNVDDKRVTRLIDGYYFKDGRVEPIKQVTLSVVDEYLVRLAADENLEDLYPEIASYADEDDLD